MELKKSAQEVLTRAQMLRLEAGMDKLCIEHIFYGLLLMASYKDEPMNTPELLPEAKELRRELEKNVRSIASAKHQLYSDAIHDNSLFCDATEVIGRASELAEDGDINAMDLFHATWENQTPTIRALAGLGIRECAKEDAKYREAPIPQMQVTSDKPQNNKEQPGGEGPTPSQMVAMLKLLAELNDNQKNQLRQNSGKVPGNKKVKRKTKLGLFTYRGGTVAAAVQYFLFGILVPLIALSTLEYFTEIVTMPPTAFVGFLVDAFIVLWGYYLARGVARLVGPANNALSHFLMILTDLGLIFFLTDQVCQAWQLDSAPTWLRIVACIAAILVVVFGYTLFNYLRSEGDVTKTKIKLQNVEGTPAKIFFQSFTKQLLFPLLVFSFFWIFKPSVPVWFDKAMWSYILLFGWDIINTMWLCMSLRYDNSSRRHKGKGFVNFMKTFHFMLGVVALVVCLHWLFGWFPMKLWVMILLSVYTLFSLIISIGAAKN